MNNQKTCSKSGIKIYETNNKNSRQYNPNQFKQQPHFNESQLTKPVSFQNTTLNSLDLDLDHYSLDDLYHLFNISGGVLSEESLKSAKQIVLKMHPDKSRLDAKYFMFFSGAYKRLYGIYEFQNKSTNKKSRSKDDDYFDESNKNVLDNMFEKNKDFKDPKNNVTKGNMNEVFEQKKKQIQALTVYTGVTDMFASTFGGSLLDGGADLSTDTYTDLRQAYTETLIPVTQEDYDKIHKFNNVSEYKAHREKIDVTPLTKEEAERKLLQQQQQHEHHSAALAFKYAKESEKAKEKQNNFWSELKQITGW